MMKRAFVTGPMSGIPDHNYPAFNRAADELRKLGYYVENPTDNTNYIPVPTDWRGWMTLALNQLLRCECVVLLPGWENSRGAKIEERLARDLGMEVMTFQEAVA
jgi:Domain of unknown function (DUF4406)